MSINQFLHKDNISTLWDVISDEDMFKFLKRDSQEKIYQMFVNNIKGFYDVERTKTNNIVDINKKYILLILNYIKKNFSQSMPNKIRILKELNINLTIIVKMFIVDVYNLKKEEELNVFNQEFSQE